jgi:squalene synthase HpnC
MTLAGELRSGKGHRDENFPVASHLVHPRFRAPILAFYEFVRVADDIADHAELAPDRKLALLDRLEGSLLGRNDDDPEGVRLRVVLAERSLTPRHAQDLIDAFRLDVTKLRYADWDELMHYCSLSAMPVGRYVLDVHGESRATWPASDAICAALQVINHLQDCGADYRDLDRVYLPLDILASHGAAIEALGAKTASPGLRSCIAELAVRTAELLRAGDGLVGAIADWRLRAEISVIHALAMRLTRVLAKKDPLDDETHLSKWQAGWIALFAAFCGATRGSAPASRPAASGSRI